MWKDSKAKRKVHYKALLKKAVSALGKFNKEMLQLDQRLAQADMLPSKYYQLSQLVEMMKQDMINLKKVIDYCTLRVIEDKKS